MSSGKTAEDSTWKSREQAAEGQYARAKEQEQLQAIRDDLAKEAAKSESEDKNFEGGYGGQEDLEDRYATTYGMH
ncbi:uncharacterized protein TRAVEDRAFT_45322 [Trametes versicolor FP-101664 SS1]|uniref:uncharacterized protein n=1 Tax=Trametes versicolor (strain FP-101664) TaxID=717944 RepID=UPI0004621AC1|nr:uncharacterized protein TRAVEDRAFT_45322 [Trametes versicolor FP-101664 SS1]EIW60070.1 hypothetical protein TRAVEDRAFT_45322 [Trametes versicolor FP-101664 SS1]